MIRSQRAGALSLACTPLLLALPLTHASAQTERELDAHEHGAATLDVVLDGNALYVDLDSPAANLVGFEHAPSTDEQRDAVARARELLESGELLIPTAAAGCTLATADVSMELEEEHGDDHDEDHDDHADDHDDDHDDHAEGETHSDVEAAWQFECESPEQLASVETRLFDEFEGFEDIDVQVAGPNGQTLVELSPDATTIELTGAP